MVTNKLKVGFIGLGLMGKPMALNIFKAGYPLSVYNREPNKLIEFKKLGVNTFDSPTDLAKNVDVLISMVTGPKDVESVMLGENGVVKSGNKSLVVIDMSTIGLTSALKVAKGLKKVGIEFVDAPVGGSTDKAQTGELIILVGASKKLFDDIKPIFDTMGTPYLIGPTGKGQAFKIVNNLMGALTIEAVAEGMVLADKLGVDRKTILKILGDAPLFSPNMKWKASNMVSKKYPVAFSIANMKKDLEIAVSEAGSIVKSLPNLKTTKKLMEEGIKQGLQDQDYSAVIKVLSKDK